MNEPQIVTRPDGFRVRLELDCGCTVFEFGNVSQWTERLYLAGGDAFCEVHKTFVPVRRIGSAELDDAKPGPGLAMPGQGPESRPLPSPDNDDFLLRGAHLRANYVPQEESEEDHGPYYEERYAVLYKGDSRKVIQRLEWGIADVMWTDPPYGVDYDSGGRKIANDTGTSMTELITKVFRIADTVLKPGAAIYIAHADIWVDAVLRTIRDVGWKHKGTLIWLKDSFVMGRKDYHWQHEPILYCRKPGKAGRFQDYGWYGGHNRSSVLAFKKPRRNPEHPTMKPISLIERCLMDTCPPGGVVLDPFAGSGSTLRAAKNLHRFGIGIELEEKYCKYIARSLGQESLELGDV